MDRRTFLFGSLAGASALAVGISLWPDSPPNTTLSDEQSWILQALVPVVLAGTHSPEELKKLAPALIDTVANTITSLPPQTRSQVDELLAVLDNQVALLALTGSTLPLAQRDLPQLNEMLDQWRFHFLDTMKLAYAGLREPILAAYWGDPSHWNTFSYQPPSLGTSS